MQRVGNISLFAAVCDPPCENGGLCVRPSVCHCGPHHEGAACQLAKAGACLDSPPTPSNARIHCSHRWDQSPARLTDL